MEKQDAIDFIVEAFDQGKSPSEIARDLSREMSAPYDIVVKFVNRTLEQRMALLGSAPPLPATEPPPIASTWETPAADWEMPPASEWELPAEPEQALDQPAYAWDARVDEVSGASTASGYSWETPVETEPEVALPEPAPAPVKAPAPVPSPGMPAVPSVSPAAGSRQIDPKLEKFILDALGSDKKHSDIVMAVCERTGLDWAEAQRVVGRVGAMNRKKVASRRNRVIIPLAVIAVLAGLALIVAGLQELALYQGILQGLIDEGAQGAVNAGLPEDAYRPDYLIATILTGLGLMVGGGVGLYQALKSQLD